LVRRTVFVLSDSSNDNVIETKFPRYHPNNTSAFVSKAASAHKPRTGASLDTLIEESSQGADDAGLL
jgi:hypothetical protein